MKLPHHITAALEKELTAAYQTGRREGLLAAELMIRKIKTLRLNGKATSKKAACEWAMTELARELESIRWRSPDAVEKRAAQMEGGR